MSLSDYQVRTETVELPGGGSFVVRGLSLADITALLSGFRPEMEAVMALIESSDSLTPQTLATVAETLLTKFPALVNNAIALAANEPDQVDKVSALPASVTLEAVNKVGRLTLEAEGGLKKVLATVVQIAQGVQGSMIDLAQPGNDGGQETQAMAG